MNLSIGEACGSPSAVDIVDGSRLAQGQRMIFWREDGAWKGRSATKEEALRAIEAEIADMIFDLNVAVKQKRARKHIRYQIDLLEKESAHLEEAKKESQ